MAEENQLIQSYMQSSLKLPAGLPGEPLSYLRDNSVRVNANRVTQVSSLRIVTSANSSAYSIYVGGILISITSASSATTTTIRDQFIAALNASVDVNGAVTASISTSDTLLLTAKNAGQALDVYTADTRMAVAVVTAASRGAALRFGQFVCLNTDVAVQPGEALPVISPAPITPVAQVETFTPTPANATFIIGINGIDGRYASSGGETLSAICDGLVNTITGLNVPVTAVKIQPTSGAYKVQVTANVAGVPFTSNESTNVTQAVSVANVAPGIKYPLDGIIEIDKHHQDGQINPDRTLTTGQKGMYKTFAEAAPASLNDPVYVRHTTGADTVNQKPGNIRPDNADGLCWRMTGVNWRSIALDNTGRATIQLNYPQAA